MKKIILTLILMSCCLFVSNALTAPLNNQQSDELRNVVSSLKFQEKIYIQTSNQGNVEGRFHKMSEDSLFVNDKYKFITIPFSEIISIKSKNGNTGSYVLGFGLGGAILGYASGQSTSDYLDNDAVSILGALTLGVVGLGVGAVIGKATESYETIYPTPQNSITVDDGSSITVNSVDNIGNQVRFNLAQDAKGDLMATASISF